MIRILLLAVFLVGCSDCPVKVGDRVEDVGTLKRGTVRRTAVSNRNCWCAVVFDDGTWSGIPGDRLVRNWEFDVIGERDML